MSKKRNVTFILDEVDEQVRKNPNGLVSKPFANKIENYLRKFINTKGKVAKSIITTLSDVQFKNKLYSLNALYSSMFSIAEYSKINVNKR